MARIHLELPAELPFVTELPVRITDVNYGGHLGNDALLGLLHEARCRFLQHHGFTEANVAGVGLIMVDAAICYRKEVFHGDVVRVAVGVTDWRGTGCDFVYRATVNATVVAEAKTGLAFFDYQKRKIVRMPAELAARFAAPASPGPSH
jgi:acyl-CoA thioesterase FadM